MSPTNTKENSLDQILLNHDFKKNTILLLHKINSYRELYEENNLTKADSDFRKPSGKKMKLRTYMKWVNNHYIRNMNMLVGEFEFLVQQTDKLVYSENWNSDLFPIERNMIAVTVFFRLWTKWNSIWMLKIEWKTVITIIFHSIWK